MNFTKKYLLNIGLAFVLLYAGINILLHPLDWIGYVPTWVTNFKVTREFMLQSHGIFEIILGLWLLSNWKVKWAGLIAALDIASIVLFTGTAQLLVTFRDVGLVFMGIYLFFDGE